MKRRACREHSRGRGRCPHYTRFLQDYVDGMLPASLSRDFERHIGNCPGCTAFLNTYRATRRLGRALAPPRIPPDLIERIVRVLCPAAAHSPTSGGARPRGKMRKK